MRPNTVLRLLQFLKANNDLYKNVTILFSNISTVLVDSLENKNAELAVDSAKKSLELKDSYLDRYRIVSNETSLIFNILKILLQYSEEVGKEEVVSIAPEEGKNFLRINIVKNLPFQI